MKVTLVFQIQLDWFLNKEISEASHKNTISIQPGEESPSNLTYWSALVLTHSRVYILPLKVPSLRQEGGNTKVAPLFLRLFEYKHERFLAQIWRLAGQEANRVKSLHVPTRLSCLRAFASPAWERTASHLFVLGWPGEVQLKVDTYNLGNGPHWFGTNLFDKAPSHK